MQASIFLQAGYGAALFLISAAALAVEIVAGRMLAPYVGMSLYTWTGIISAVLAGLTIGHWIGGRWAEAARTPQQARFRIGLALIAAAITTAAALPLLRAVSGPLLGLGMHPAASIIVLSTFLFLPPSLFAGIISPILTKLAVDCAPHHTGRILGRMYALGAAGSILGTLTAGYVLISWVGSAGSMTAAAALYAILALPFFARRARKAAAAALMLGGAGLSQMDSAFASPCVTESDYYCLRVEDFSPQSGRESAVLVLDHLGHGINDAADPRLFYSSYLQFTDEIAKRRFGRGRLDAYFIGGGAFTLPRAWSQIYDDPHLLAAEIDPAVTRIARERLWLPADSKGLRIEHQDARTLLQSLPREPAFDVVFGDAFHDIGIPPHLVTREFHAEIAARLKPGGFYAINVIEARHEPRFLLALLQTLRHDFAAVEVWVDGDEMSQGERVTYLVLASDAPEPFPRVVSSSFPARQWLRLRDDQVREKTAQARVPDLTDDFSPVDRLMAHILLSPEIGEQ